METSEESVLTRDELKSGTYGLGTGAALVTLIGITAKLSRMRGRRAARKLQPGFEFKCGRSLFRGRVKLKFKSVGY